MKNAPSVSVDSKEKSAAGALRRLSRLISAKAISARDSGSSRTAALDRENRMFGKLNVCSALNSSTPIPALTLLKKNRTKKRRIITAAAALRFILTPRFL